MVNDELEDLHFFKTNANGKIIEEIKVPSSITYYEYDNKGNLISEVDKNITEYNKEDPFESTTNYTSSKILYDSSGHRTRTSYYYSPFSEFISNYNEKGEVLSEKLLEEEETKGLKTYEYQYNDKGLWVFQLVFEDDYFLHVNERRYEYF